MEEIKRRSRVVGVFPNQPACHRLTGAGVIETDEKRQVEQRSYFNMEHLERQEPNSTEGQRRTGKQKLAQPES